MVQILGRDLVIIKDRGQTTTDRTPIQVSGQDSVKVMGGMQDQAEDNMEGTMLRGNMGDRGWDRRGGDTEDREEETGHKWEENFKGQIQIMGAEQDKYGMIGIGGQWGEGGNMEQVARDKV